MDCEHVQHGLTLAKLAMGEQAPAEAEALHQHLATCDDCRQRYRMLRGIVRSLPALVREGEIPASVLPEGEEGRLPVDLEATLLSIPQRAQAGGETGLAQAGAGVEAVDGAWGTLSGQSTWGEAGEEAARGALPGGLQGQKAGAGLEKALGSRGGAGGRVSPRGASEGLPVTRASRPGWRQLALGGWAVGLSVLAVSLVSLQGLKWAQELEGPVAVSLPVSVPAGVPAGGVQSGLCADPAAPCKSAIPLEVRTPKGAGVAQAGAGPTVVISSRGLDLVAMRPDQSLYRVPLEGEHAGEPAAVLPLGAWMQPVIASGGRDFGSGSWWVRVTLTPEGRDPVTLYASEGAESLSAVKGLAGQYRLPKPIRVEAGQVPRGWARLAVRLEGAGAPRAGTAGAPVPEGGGSEGESGSAETWEVGIWLAVP